MKKGVKSTALLLSPPPIEYGESKPKARQPRSPDGQLPSPTGSWASKPWATKVFGRSGDGRMPEEVNQAQVSRQENGLDVTAMASRSNQYARRKWGAKTNS